MRICIVNTFHYHRGGDSTYAFDLAALLAAHGHQVVHFAMKHPSNLPSEFERYFVDEIDYRAISERGGPLAKAGALVRSLYSVQARRRFAALLDATKPDVVHLQNFRRHLTFSILPEARRRGIPVVKTAHDYDVICPNSLLFARGQVCEACRGRHYYRAATVRCKDGQRLGSLAVALESYFAALMGYHGMIDVIVTPSRFTRAKMIEFGQDPARIRVIPNFLDLAGMTPAEGKGYAITSGRLSAEKGIGVLLEALRRLPDLRVLIAGDGPCRRDLEAMAVKLGLANAEFLGYVPRDRLVELVGGAAFVVIPSVCPENFPYSVLEAFALGKPVIGSRIGGIPELVRPGVTGLLAEPGDPASLAEAIERLRADPSLGRTLGGAGRKLVETELSPAVHYARISDLYQSLVAGRREAGGEGTAHGPD